MDMYGIYLDSPISSLTALLQQNNAETATMSQNLHVQTSTKAGDMSLPIKKHVLLNILYHRYIPGIYLSYLCSSTLAALGLPVLPNAQGHFGSGLSEDPFCFCDRKPSNLRLGPAEVPQPSVDLINMAAL
jgi:hypothetical protein